MVLLWGSNAKLFVTIWYCGLLSDWDEKVERSGDGDGVGSMLRAAREVLAQSS